MKKVLAIALSLAIILAFGLSGCGAKSSGGTDTSTSAAAATTQNVANTASGGPDFSKKLTIELMQAVWVGTPRGDDDPYLKWINETFNVDFKLTAVQNFNDQIMVRFSSGDAPDMVSYNDKTSMLNIYNQGVLVDDWNKYKDEIPTVFKGMSDAQVKALSKDGKLELISAPSGLPTWSWKIRKDWLTKLGLSMPTTPEELLNVARKFTFNDPDGNGKNDTYAFTSAGMKQYIGEIGYLVSMWGPYGYYITSDNKVSHPIVDGNWKKLLDFLKIAVKEKLIDPDWFTISWNDRKPKLFNGTYGICYYPGVIANETENGAGNTGKTVDWWETLPTPKGSEEGGKISAGNLFESIRSVSAAAAKDQEKIDRILAILENTAYPNDGFWKLRWGVDIDNFKMTDIGDGFKFFNSFGKAGVNKRGYYEGGNTGLYDWGYSISTSSDKVLEGSSDEMDKATKAQFEMNKVTMQLPTYGNEGSVFSLDSKVTGGLTVLQSEFDYKYIMGQETDYEAFKSKWLSSGGQSMLDEATKQAQALGLFK
jgi:hypothetical protein